MFTQRAERARFLARHYPASAELLLFYAGIADWQSRVTDPGFDKLREAFPSLLELVARTGPPALAETANRLSPQDFDSLVSEYWTSVPGRFSLREFFARVLLQPYAGQMPEGLDCPWCGRLPQSGCLKPEGNGLALELVCALCFRRRTFPRGRCPGCGESSETRLAGYSAIEFPHLRLQACEACKGYLMLVDLSRDPGAIPDVDEMAGLPLDVWAAGQGYHKLQPNLAGV